MRKKEIAILLFFALMLVMMSVANAGEPPEGFCGYPWGTTPNEMPNKTFVMRAGGGAYIYSIDNMDELDFSTLLPSHVKPNSVRVIYGGNMLFEAQVKLRRKDAEAVRQFLIQNYGQPIKRERTVNLKNGYWISYTWTGDLTEIALMIFSDGTVNMTVDDEVYLKAQP